MFILIFVVSAVIISCFFYAFTEDEKEIATHCQIKQEDKFFVSEYFERTEKIYNDILKEKEKQAESEEYIIVLWWGFDGLRLNKDGSSEWIRKEEESDCLQKPHIESKVVTTIPFYGYGYGYILNNPLINPLTTQIQQCCSTSSYIDLLQSQCTQNRIVDLQSQNTLLQIQLAQSEQNMIITRNIKQSINFESDAK